MEVKTTAIAFVILAFISLASRVECKKKGNILMEKVVAMDSKINSLQAGLTTLGWVLDQQIVSLEKKIDSLISAKDCTRPACPEGWSEFEGSCYRFVETELSWDDAEGYCSSLGGYLAETESEEEDTFIFNLFKNSGEFGPWLGAHDRRTEGAWIWSHSGKALNYTNWDNKHNEPNGGASENCLHYSNSYSHVWNDVDCTKRYKFICEMSKNVVVF